MLNTITDYIQHGKKIQKRAIAVRQEDETLAEQHP